MESNKTYLVTNRSASILVYSIPEMNIYREYQAGETKKVSHEEIERLSYQTGGDILITQYLLIQDSEAIAELGVHTEPEYFMTEKEVIDLIKNGSMDAWLDFFDFATEGGIDLIKKLSVTVPLTDTEKRKVLKAKTGFDVDAAIRHTTEDTEDINNIKEAPVRRRTAPVAEAAPEQPVRRTEVPQRKVVKKG
jgi:hypothetical protein